MRTVRSTTPLLPVVQEPRVQRCGHYIADFTPQEAQALSYLALDLTAIQIAEAINHEPDRENARPVSSDMVRDRLNSLRVKAGAQTWVQLVDVACRTKLLLPRPATLKEPLPAQAVATMRLAVLGHTHHRIAAIRGISPATVAAHLAQVRYRMRTHKLPAAVYRLHGVPGVLNSAPYCLACRTGGTT
ncbi:LuxR C-terminal-related transcriptional regulator [Kitasatospora xanthocidica]|uniref:LuxR C-terminal-related transcriptional regulator n=1 Tax=Kitasatospora xanthocidica TaxID=83382 RepID=UPI0036EC8E7D